MKNLILTFALMFSLNLFAEETVNGVTFQKRRPVANSETFYSVGYKTGRGVSGYFLIGDTQIICRLLGYERGTYHESEPYVSRGNEEITILNADGTVYRTDTADKYGRGAKLDLMDTITCHIRIQPTGCMAPN